MEIQGAQLEQEYERARNSWPAIHSASKKYHLPPFSLYAVGSRETNLQNEIGDGGHGHGIFQLDDRSHTIPSPFPVAEQCEIAARMLHGLFVQFQGNHRAAFAAYNCGAGNVQAAMREGRDVDYYTTGRNYGADVVERMRYLQQVNADPTRPPVEPDCFVEPAVDHDIVVSNEGGSEDTFPPQNPDISEYPTTAVSSDPSPATPPPFILPGSNPPA